MDGWITIGTDIDSQEFEKEMKRLEKESEKFAKEEDKLLKSKAKLEIDMSKSDREIDNLNKKIENTFKKLSAEKNKLASIPSWQKDSTEYNKQNFNVDKVQQSYDSLVAKHKDLLEKQSFYNSELDTTRKKLIENTTHQNEVNSKLQEMEAESLGLHMNFDRVGESLMNNVKKVGKWAMAIFSLRSAYNAVRQSMSILTQYNEDLANRLNSIKLVFASALEPVITRVVDLVYRLMVYMNYISKAWFGVDLFAKASAKSMAKASKSAKEMRKDLFGFDEANIQNDNGTTGVANAGAGSGFIEPKDVPIPSWVQWIADNKDKVLGFITALGVGIAAIKFTKFLANLTETGRKLSGLSSSAGQATSSMKNFGMAIGTGMIITGLLTIATAVGDLIFNWDELTPAQKRADAALVALGTSFVVLGMTIRTAINTGTFGISSVIGLIVGLGTAVVGLIGYFDKEKTVVHSLKDAQDNLKVAQDNLRKSTEDHSNALEAHENALKKAEEATKNLETAEEKYKIKGADLLKQVTEGKLKIDDMTKAQKEVYKAYIDNYNAQGLVDETGKKLDETIKQMTEDIKENTIASFENEHATMLEKEQYDEYKKAVIDAFNDGSLKADEARTLIERCMSDMSNSSRKTFVEDLPSQISDGLDPKKYESLGSKLKTWFSNLWKSIWGNKPSTSDISSWTGTSNLNSVTKSAPKINHAKGAVITYPKIKYHANGAIINQPGRGVPLVDHRGGERGHEGVLPLTDAQQMDLLGSTIAKHLSLNATIPIYMGNRQIAREIKKIDIDSEFAANR